MLRPAFVAVCLLFAVCACSDDSTTTPAPGGSDPVTIRLDTYAGFKADLTALATGPNAAAAMTAVWDTLRTEERFPFVHEDSVMFLYRGAGTQTTVAGDFNGWDPTASPATALGTGGVWIREEIFPTDARVDYKYVLGGSQWILDPENPLVQRGGFGDNSELRMPDYVPSPWVVRDPSVPRGTLTPATLASSLLGYPVDYVVYTPAGYAGLDNLPVVYVTDGHEYADEFMGSMVEVLDNLMDAGLLQPVMAVFIDPRVGGSNIRAEQYILNPDFAGFVARELVPVIDGAYATDDRREARCILGTSLGGLNAAYFGVQETGTFGLLACQSPAFQAGDSQIITLYEDADLLDLDIMLTWGTMHDVAEYAEAFLGVLDTKGYVYETIVVNEGHSWGNWRALLDDMLLHYWAVN